MLLIFILKVDSQDSQIEEWVLRTDKRYRSKMALSCPLLPLKLLHLIGARTYLTVKMGGAGVRELRHLELLFNSLNHSSIDKIIFLS